MYLEENPTAFVITTSKKEKKIFKENPVLLRKAFTSSPALLPSLFVVASSSSLPR